MPCGGCTTHARRNNNETAHPVGSSQCRIDGNTTSQGTADQHRLVVLQRIHHCPKVGDIGMRRGVQRARLSEAPPVVARHWMGWCHCTPLALPHASVRNIGVQKKNWHAGSAVVRLVLDCQRRARDFDPFQVSHARDDSDQRPCWPASETAFNSLQLSGLCVSPQRPGRYLADSRNPRRILFSCAASTSLQ